MRISQQICPEANQDIVSEALLQVIEQEERQRVMHSLVYLA